MLVGDSAGQLISATGAGIHSGVVAGRIAGKVASLAIQDNDLSENRLSEYVNRFDEYWGKRIATLHFPTFFFSLLIEWGVNRFKFIRRPYLKIKRAFNNQMAFVKYVSID